MKLKREIAIYQKDGDKYIDSFEINLPIEKLVNILNVDLEDDPEIYNVYEIDENQYLQLKELVPELSKINFHKVAMFYECCQVG